MNAWLAGIDRAVEREVQWLKWRRFANWTLWTLAMGFVLGCMFEALTGLTSRFMEWFG